MWKLSTKFAPQPAAFELAQRAGFRYAELWLNAALLADWQEIARLGRQCPLEYVLHFPNSPEVSPETLEQAVLLYRALESRCLVIHQGEYNRFLPALLSLEPGLQLAVENHFLDPAGIAEWAESNSGLALDVEHFWMLTLRDAPLEVLLTQLRDFVSRWHPKLRHVHLPGYVPGFTEHRPMYCSREMTFAVFSLLQEFNFEGFVVSEVDLEFQTFNDLKMDVLMFETWTQRHAA